MASLHVELCRQGLLSRLLGGAVHEVIRSEDRKPLPCSGLVQPLVISPQVLPHRLAHADGEFFCLPEDGVRELTIEIVPAALRVVKLALRAGMPL